MKTDWVIWIGAMLACFYFGITLGVYIARDSYADRACAEACGIHESLRASGRCRCVKAIEPTEAMP